MTCGSVHSSVMIDLSNDHSTRLAMFKRLRCLGTFLLVTLTTIVGVFSILQFYTVPPVVFNNLYSVAVTDRDTSKAQFSFPEVNETKILLFPNTNIGQVRHLYFLENAIQGQENKTVSDGMLFSFFQQGVSYEERQIMLFLFQTFVHTCVKFNVTFFLYGGTLLGSFRHHDIIPWDDDIDVIANSSLRESLRKALSSEGVQFDLYCPKRQRWKFFWTKANTLSHKHFRWPYIDIFFYSENITHIFDESEEYRNSFVYPKGDIFPLSLHPFAGAMLPVPCKLRNVVEWNYSPSLCASPKYSHKLESLTPKDWWAVVPCWRLYRLFPFVHKRFVWNKVRETLFKGQQVLSVINLPVVCS